MSNGVLLSGVKCAQCGGYEHESFGDNLLVCTNCAHRIENPMLQRCPNCNTPTEIKIGVSLRENPTAESGFICPNCKKFLNIKDVMSHGK